ncbi:MAG: hypothetical protein MUD06_09245 [Rhodospirillales bacterium]|nr:hypothetical protein [Rhodospirillales bacterium]
MAELQCLGKMKGLLFILLVTTCYTGGVNLPTKRFSISPDFRWQVRCVTEKRSEGFLHSILLSRFGVNEEVSIWVCDRSCDVLWSDDSQRLAITDWTGSSLSELYLVETSVPKARRLEVTGIAKLIRKEELEGHCYQEALQWESPRRLAIRIFSVRDLDNRWTVFRGN